MDHNYSIFQWDVGTCGSFIHCMSDFIRYDIPFSEDYLPGNAYRPDTVVQIIDDIPYNNEFKAGLYADELKNWYTNPPNVDTRDECIRNISDNGVSDHIKMHWLSFQTEEYFGMTFSRFGYKKYIKIQAATPHALILMHFKRTGRDPFKDDVISDFIIDENRDIVQRKITSQFFDMRYYKDTEIFKDREIFNSLINDMSGKDYVPDIIWEFAQEYSDKNKKIVEWMYQNRREICSQYNDKFWSNMIAL